MAYAYTVEVTRTKTITETGTFIVKSKTKLTEDEVVDKAQHLASEDDPEDGWGEADEDADYESEITDGEDNLKAE